MLRYNQFKLLFENKNNHLIKDGLIYSFSYSKFIEKLRNLLEKYDISYEKLNSFSDGVILNKLFVLKNKYFYNELISLLNISGYYISSYKSDNNKIEYGSLCIKTYMESKYLNITFNKNFDFQEKGIKLKLYHLTDKKFIDKIKKNGLTPKSTKMIDNHPDRIYLFEDIDDLNDFSKQKSFYSKEFEPITLKINTKVLPKLKLYLDPKYPNTDAYYTYDNIPPYAINIID